MLVRTCSQMVARVVNRLLILIVVMLFMSACQPAVTAFRPPNLNELQAFLKDHGITPVEDKLLGDSLVLLYEDNTSFGYYTLTVREPEGVLASDHASAAKSDQPVLIIGQLTGDRPFMAVVIQDAALSAETAAIEVALDAQNRLTATTDGRAGAILVSPSPVNDWTTITLYDAQGKVLYRQPDHPVQQLRVVNSGSTDIMGLTVLFPGSTAVEFGDVPAGHTTEYQDVPSGVYRYAAYRYMLDSRLVTQPVRDWVGESPMEGERFTYRIDLDSQKEHGSRVDLIEVVVDKP